MKQSTDTRTLILESKQKIGEKITLKGWVQTVRSHGKIAFLDLRDRTGVIQVGAFGSELASQVASLHVQDIVSIEGLVKKREERYINTHLPTGDIEVEAQSIQVIQKADEMPFDMGGKDLNLELPTLLDHRSLTLRHPKVLPIFILQEKIADAFRTVAKELGCTEIFVPTISASATEGGAEVFKVKYYDYNAFLTQSPQLYKQIMVGVFERVFTFSHAYRAEPSVTTRHLSEVVQLDIEVGFINSFNELLDMVEFVGSEMINRASTECEYILTQFGQEKPRIPKNIPRLTLREAQEVIYKRTKRDVRTEKDLSPEDERELWRWALEEHESDFVTITHFPTFKRSFYTMPDPKDPEFSLSFDLLFRGEEISSGSERITDYNELVNTIKKRGMDPKEFGMYLQAFQYGIPKEGGFSFGLERVTAKILGLSNVREASLFPRDMERVDERLSQIQKTKTEKK